jgi:nitrogen-specific signal transduction histidine kinase
VYSSWNYSPVSDECGRVTHIVATYRDLTEKRSLLEALVHSQRLDSVGRVAGGVAHDFNNLLSVIGGYCEIMASKRAVRRLVARELNEVHVASEKAAYLVGQLLAFSRRQPGGHRVVNLDKLIRGSSEILSRLMKPSYSLEFLLQAENANIRVDPAQIQQVLLNLVLNARDALMEGGVVTVASEVRGACPDGSLRRNFAVLVVSDNGSGMSDEVRARIFEPFFTTKENGRGTGLGLALVHSVIQQCGGFIQVTSAPGKGSTFEIFFPLANRRAKQENRYVPPLPATRGREHVLLIEEDVMVRAMVADIFRADGYTVVAVATTSEALEFLMRPPLNFDLLIAQTRAKRTHTEEIFAQILVRSLPAIRVLTTGNTDPALFANLSLSQQANLPKPFTLSSLLRAARHLLDVTSFTPTA